MNPSWAPHGPPGRSGEEVRGLVLELGAERRFGPGASSEPRCPGLPAVWPARGGSVGRFPIGSGRRALVAAERSQRSCLTGGEGRGRPSGTGAPGCSCAPGQKNAGQGLGSSLIKNRKKLNAEQLGSGRYEYVHVSVRISPRTWVWMGIV